jgi:FtsZ-binding cell division protein ZapB
MNWIEIAEEAQLDLWERQPQETDHEFHVWMRYRDAYPGKRPTYKDVAEEVGISPDAVKHVARRWDFTTRMQAWSKHIDDITMQQRQAEILAMNEHHIDMASRLNAKISKAIDLISVDALSPREINSLMKTATELEKKARLDIAVPQRSVLQDENPDLKQEQVKTSEIQEILTILGKAGKLENFGVRQTTTTTEVVVKD